MMNYGGFGGGPGYFDPLSMRGPQVGIGRFMMSNDPVPGMAGGPMGPPSAPGIIENPAMGPYPAGPGAQGGGIGRKVGSHIKGALDWLTDEEQGGNRTNLLLGGLGLGMQAYGAHQDREAYEEEVERQRKLEDEQRQRMAAASPFLAQMLPRRGG